MGYTGDLNSLHFYIRGLSYLIPMDNGLSIKILPLYKGKSAEGGKGYFCDWRCYALPPRPRWLFLNL